MSRRTANEEAAEPQGTPWYKSITFIVVCWLLAMAAVVSGFLIFRGGVISGMHRRLQIDNEQAMDEPSSSSNVSLIQATVAIIVVATAVAIQSIFIYIR